MDMADHQDMMSSLIQPLLPVSSETVMSPPPVALVVTPNEAPQNGPDIQAEFSNDATAEVPNERGQESAYVKERLQEISEAETRGYRRTMGQQKGLMTSSTM
jgi:hypothetical protein